MTGKRKTKKEQEEMKKKQEALETGGKCVVVPEQVATAIGQYFLSRPLGEVYEIFNAFKGCEAIFEGQIMRKESLKDKPKDK